MNFIFCVFLCTRRKVAGLQLLLRQQLPDEICESCDFLWLNDLFNNVRGCSHKLFQRVPVPCAVCT